MSKLPFMKFYPSDWTTDTRFLSVETKGAWIDLLCQMWVAKDRGKITMDLAGYARLFGCDQTVAKRIICELVTRGVCVTCNASSVTGNTNVPEFNGDVTLISRRIYRDASVREQTRCRVDRFRKRKCNAVGNANETVQKSEVRSHIDVTHEGNASDETQQPEEKIAFDFGTRTWSGISDQDRDAWATAYPAVDVDREMAAAGEWCLGAGPKGHKKNWRKFLTGWFGRCQQRGGSSPNAGAANYDCLAVVREEYTRANGSPPTILDDVARMISGISRQHPQPVFKKIIRKFLADQDQRLVNDGHPLSALRFRVDRYTQEIAQESRDCDEPHSTGGGFSLLGGFDA